jgi:beta-galactosidase
MMKRILTALFLVLLASIAGAAVPTTTTRIVQSFDTNWLFLKADAPGAEELFFDDFAWRKLDVPHDWSIEGPFSQTNSTGGAGAWLPSGIGWYRHHFTLPTNDTDRCVFIEFDGVMANSDVWINGFHLGHRPYGYVSFQYELTSHLNFGGKDNVIAVKADTSAQPASRYYFGAGIYRHVRLIITDPVHIAPWGVYVTTPKVSATLATVHVQTVLTNESDTPREISVTVILSDPSQQMVAGDDQEMIRKIGARSVLQIDEDFAIKNPQLWDLEKPILYHANAVIDLMGANPENDRRICDDLTVPFGIRDAAFKPDTGFWLNGKNIKLKGVCLHQDGGAFGIAVPLGIWEERFKALKEIGVNAIRTAHNPPDPAFLDLCDRMGFLVMDEMFDCWTVAKNRFDYHLYFNDWSLIDTHDTVLRDRNHPSIILYSAGNEIHDTPNATLSLRILRGLVADFHANDPSRPVTQALFRPNVSHDYDDGLADLLDVIGTNYRDNELLAAQRAKLTRILVNTEEQHGRAPWVMVRDNPPLSGQFLWSGIDYLGEARTWPATTASSGLLDRTGRIKPMAAERESWWSEKPMVIITRRTAEEGPTVADPGYETAQQDLLRRPQTLYENWTPANTGPHRENVEIYSDCPQVELFLNGNSLGSKPLNRDASPRAWQVNYASGTIKAVGKNDGKIVATQELRTAGKAAKIIVTAANPSIPANYDGVSMVIASVQDESGTTVPTANPLLSFKISGPGVIAAVDNADNSSHASFQAKEINAWQGSCVAFVKASAPSGEIILTASAPGLTGGSIKLKAAPASQ